MRRIEYGGKEYLIRTRSGWRLREAMAEQGVQIDCKCNQGAHENCLVKFPKDTLFLLVDPSHRERQALTAQQIKGGTRLACEALYK